MRETDVADDQRVMNTRNSLFVVVSCSFINIFSYDNLRCGVSTTGYKGYGRKSNPRLTSLLVVVSCSFIDIFSYKIGQ